MSTKRLGRAFKRALTATASASILAMAATTAHALPGRDDVGIDGMVDAGNQWAGVGMMFSGGFVCTGQLINPRTVIFAAHCADNFPNASYGTFGTEAMAFSFGVDALPGFQNWFANAFASNPDLHVYNVLQLQSVLDTSFSFPGADVAMATLDTPAIGLPTYGMLFSPIDGARHVSMVGYGRNGTGSAGPGGIDWKRRAGENMVDALISQDDFLGATFGIAPGSWSGLVGPSGSQLMYHTDFDRPGRNPNDCTRGPAFLGPNDITCATPPFSGAITFDFTSAVQFGDHMDWFPGDALPREAGTAGGDSGSALFSNFGGRELILGVLSGGWNFTSPNGGYGDLSYYNPLFLYQNWIVAQNPMVYASAVAGDGNWSDASHWQQDIDPNYFVLDANGNAVNGLSATAPTSALDAMTLPGNPFGTIFDTEVNAFRAGGAPAEAGNDGNLTVSSIGSSNFRGTASLPGMDNKASDTQVQDGNLSAPAADEPKGSGNQIQDVDLSGDFGATVSQDGTSSVVSNLAPGTWVPNNHFGTYGTFNDPSASTARFFNVNLSNAGTTTLDMNVELDTMGVSNADARFNIGAPWTFNTLIAFNQSAGTVDLNGRVNAREYMMTGGLLMGTGELNTMTLWNVGGTVMPGSESATGTLTVMGDYVQTSAGRLVINVGNGGNSVLNVTGAASLDGELVFNPLAGYTPQFGDSVTFLNAASTVGAFASVVDLPGALTPTVSVAAGTGRITLSAANFNTQATFTNAFQTNIAAALDAGRASSYNALEGVYTPLDLLNDGALTTALDSLSPYEAVQFDRSVRVHSTTLNSALMSHIGSGYGHGGDDISMVLASVEQHSGNVSDTQSLSGAKSLFRRVFQDGGSSAERGVRAFGELGMIQADTQMIVGTPDSAVDGHFTLFGFEASTGGNWSGGLALGFADTENVANSTLGVVRSEVDSTQFTLFAAYRGDVLSAVFQTNSAEHDNLANRNVNLGGIIVPSVSKYGGSSFGAGATFSWNVMGEDANVRWDPVVSIDYNRFEFESATSSAGTAGLNIAGREVDSVIGRVGFAFRNQGSGIRPYFYAGLAKEMGSGNELYSANFSSAPSVSFSAPGGYNLANTWMETAMGVDFNFEDGSSLTFGYETDINRDVIDREIATISYSRTF